MTIDFHGKKALVTGGSRGIGLATSLALAEAGADIAFTYERNDDSAASARDRIESMGRRVLAFKLDARDEAAHEAMMASIMSEWRGLDILIANAGIWKGGRIDEMPLADFRETMEVNMTGTFLAVKHASRAMKAAKHGAIVIISSTAGQRGESEHSHYAASKGAQISFTKSLAVELAPFGIRVNCVAPGWVGTAMTRATLEDPAQGAEVLRVIPLGRVGEPEEIANAILFLASPLASFITGEILNVNGGAVLCG